MAEPLHPGPWTAEPWGPHWTLIRDAHGDGVARVTGNPEWPTPLLVRAAPDLLAACQDAAAWIAQRQPIGDDQWSGEDVMAALRAAIARATGQPAD